MANKTEGTFRDNLTPVDRIGRKYGGQPNMGGDFGDGGKSYGGEPMNNRGAGEDEMTMRDGGNYERPDKTSRVSRGSY